jgi:hypothetical protein
MLHSARTKVRLGEVLPVDRVAERQLRVRGRDWWERYTWGSVLGERQGVATGLERVELRHIDEIVGGC